MLLLCNLEICTKNTSILYDFRCLEDQQLRERETVEHQRRVDENETLRLQNEAAIASQNATHRQREDENQRRRLQNETRRLHNEAAIAVEREAHQQREDEHKKLHLENESRSHHCTIIVKVVLYKSEIRLLNEAEDRKMTNELARLSLGDDSEVYLYYYVQMLACYRSKATTTGRRKKKS